jgi:hypothetical protein
MESRAKTKEQRIRPDSGRGGGPGSITCDRFSDWSSPVYYYVAMYCIEVAVAAVKGDMVSIGRVRAWNWSSNSFSMCTITSSLKQHEIIVII